tara:strand:- start:103 stop:285 length:183 start_codon:yes stop_codon:yes gene_type:complete
MEAVSPTAKIYELEFLEGDYVYIGSDIVAESLEEAKSVAIFFLKIPEDAELISSKVKYMN